nr:MAG TPA: hypothetical protein [Caudoviricetes sp.]
MLRIHSNAVIDAPNPFHMPLYYCLAQMYL